MCAALQLIHPSHPPVCVLPRGVFVLFHFLYWLLDVCLNGTVFFFPYGRRNPNHLSLYSDAINVTNMASVWSDADNQRITNVFDD